MKTFIERLDALRRPGESKRDFSKRIGISPVQLSRYYSGNIPGRKVMERISKRTGASLDWLLHGVEIFQDPEPVRRLGSKSSRTLTDKDRVELACSYLDQVKRLDRERREAIKELLRLTVKHPVHLEKILSYLGFLKFEETRKKKNPQGRS